MSDPMTVSRRLVAVFAADVEGYSRLMGADEVGTLKGLTVICASDGIGFPQRRKSHSSLRPQPRLDEGFIGIGAFIA